MRETTKSRPGMLARGVFEKYLHGNGIDVGCGDDPLELPEDTGSVMEWDKEDGDAQELPGIEAGQFDWLYSSHCLEHLRDIPWTLRRWVEVVRPGGFLYVVVPCFTRYEQHCWPSRYNADHKHSFSLDLTRDRVNRPNHWHTSDLGMLMGGQHPLMGPPKVIPTPRVKWMETSVEDAGFNYNAGPGDQTLHGALAQIRFVWRKV